jgi:hypothetical protein
MARRRRRHGSPHCDRCGAVITFFTAAHNGKRRPFEPAPYDRTGPAQRIAYPVENGSHWWRPRDLVADLMERRGIGEVAAQVEVDDMPWYATHVCTLRPDTPADDELEEVTG